MTEFIEQHRPALAALCRRHHVRTLELFGSAADGSFQPDRSDLDLLVDFQPMAPSDRSRRLVRAQSRPRRSARRDEPLFPADDPSQPSDGLWLLKLPSVCTTF